MVQHGNCTISPAMADVLAHHLDGPQLMPAETRRRLTTRCLIKRGWLREIDEGTRTEITATGRAPAKKAILFYRQEGLPILPELEIA